LSLIFEEVNWDTE